ncbi:MAG: family 10 glycosylhydrolase [Bacteroidales bacterium]|nr:family 10 glycosylhydrolase [Bacteroidales bacterium]
MKLPYFKFNRKLLVLMLLVATIGTSCANSVNESIKDDRTKLMWLDATANIQRFNNKDTIDYYLTKLKNLGFTDVVVDMRPISGYVMYDSDIAPKLKKWRGDTIIWSFDYMGYYIEKGHSLGLNIQASLNTFVAGHNHFDKGIIYEEDKLDWASMVYRVDGEIVPITNEKQKYSAMVNPINPEYQDYIISIFKELVQKYPELDGLILDRVRYDGFMTDFSELSKTKFEEYIGKKLENFPGDIYEWKKDELGNDYPHKGKYYMEWLQWRSQNIYDFMAKAREEVKSVNPDISFGTYTGAWYPSYFEVGVNFASKNYDPSKEFDWATQEYKNTGYAELMDLFTVGNYYTTITKEEYMKENPEVKNETDMEAQSSIWYCVEGSNENLRRVMGDNKFLGGILADQFYENHDGLTESIKMNLETSDGLMIFDIVHIINKDMWQAVEKGMREANVIE